MQDVEPFYGWRNLYDPDNDEYSPFYGEEHSEFYFENQVYDYLAHPQWETIDSESLLLKILYVNYEEGCAVIELFGVWNDLLQNDYRLLAENCLYLMIRAGVNRFVFICENILNIYLEADDYYAAVEEELEGGWIALVGARQHVLEEMEQYGIGDYFFWAPQLPDLKWRKLKPMQLIELTEARIGMVL